MPRYGLPNPTKPITSLSKGSMSPGTKSDLKLTNPSQSKTSFSTPGTSVPKTKDYGVTPHRLGVKTMRVKSSGKSMMGK